MPHVVKVVLHFCSCNGSQFARGVIIRFFTKCNFTKSGKINHAILCGNESVARAGDIFIKIITQFSFLNQIGNFVECCHLVLTNHGFVFTTGATRRDLSIHTEGYLNIICLSTKISAEQFENIGFLFNDLRNIKRCFILYEKIRF